jgi:hypothetical protein
VKTIKTLVLVLVALAVAMPAAAQPARLYDKEVKSLIEQSKKTFEGFWDALDSQLKNTTFKGPSGEWVVKKLGDFAVTYELNVYVDEPTGMARIYAELHRQVLDVFNEYGVQIMTPAYEGDPEQPKLVRKEDWHLPPAPPAKG